MAAASIRLVTPNVITEPSRTTFLDVAGSMIARGETSPV